MPSINRKKLHHCRVCPLKAQCLRKPDQPSARSVVFRYKLEGYKKPVRLARRAQIVLLAAEGKSNLEIAQILKIGRHQVSRWCHRYAREGFSGIEQDRARSGRKKQIDAAEIVSLTTNTLPENATHWSTRTMAAVSGISERSVRRIWHAYGLKPHLEKTFKVSRDPKFVEKMVQPLSLQR